MAADFFAIGFVVAFVAVLARVVFFGAVVFATLAVLRAGGLVVVLLTAFRVLLAAVLRAAACVAAFFAVALREGVCRDDAARDLPVAGRALEAEVLPARVVWATAREAADLREDFTSFLVMMYPVNNVSAGRPATTREVSKQVWAEAPDEK
ncbi:MAG: hypothetical protein LBB65_01370 [Burkholderiales bacterium]|nr:hypothetical protein [Burkholderiales bacterium]